MRMSSYSMKHSRKTRKLEKPKFSITPSESKVVKNISKGRSFAQEKMKFFFWSGMSLNK